MAELFCGPDFRFATRGPAAHGCAAGADAGASFVDPRRIWTSKFSLVAAAAPASNCSPFRQRRGASGSFATASGAWNSIGPPSASPMNPPSNNPYMRSRSAGSTPAPPGAGGDAGAPVACSATTQPAAAAPMNPLLVSMPVPRLTESPPNLPSGPSPWVSATGSRLLPTFGSDHGLCIPTAIGHTRSGGGRPRFRPIGSPTTRRSLSVPGKPVARRPEGPPVARQAGDAPARHPRRTRLAHGTRTPDR